MAFAYFVALYQIDYQILLPDGSTEPVYLRASFTTTLAYIIYFFLVALLMSWFSSSRRRAELLLNHARGDLEVKVEERTADLRQANQQLRAEVTERKRAEGDLRRSEAFLAEAQRLSRSGSFGWRVSTSEILWSEETFRIFQYDRSTIPTIELILQRVHPEDVDLVKQTLDRASEEGKNFDHEYRLVMPDSSIKYVHVVAHSLNSESGGTEFIGAVMDITIAKKSEDRIRQIIDTVPALIWTARPDGSLDFISQRWLDYAGITLEQAQGSELGAQCHPDDCDQLRRKWRAAVTEGKPFETEARVRRLDGEHRWFLIRAFPLFEDSGHIVGWYGNDIDIQDRKQAEEKLKQSEAYLHEAQRLGHMGSWAHNVSSGTLFASPELLRIFGRDPDEEKLTVEKFRERIHPEDRPFIEEVANKSTNEKTDFEFDYRIVLPEGSIKWVYSVAHPVFDDSGDLLEYIGTIIDVTERKETEDALRQAQADLAHVSRVTTMGELVASIAHEVNQPLGAIVTNGHACVRLLSRETPDLDKSREVIERMIGEGMRASKVIKRIRDLLHKAPPEKAPLNINDPIQEVIALVSSDVHRSRVKLFADLASDLPQVIGDRVQLQQVILNLILNAKDAMSAVQTHPRELLITSRKSKSGQVVVAVRDSGKGLDPKDTDRIFDPFFSTKPEGMGLGLSISRTIIEDHHGTLWATPNEDKGATVQFTLPAGNGREF